MVGLTAALVVLGVWGGSASGAVVFPSAGGLSAPSGAWLGASCQPSGGRTLTQQLANCQQEAHRRFAVVHFYRHWGDSLTPKSVVSVAGGGQVPLINWNATVSGVSWADIAAGRQDAAIITAAKQLKALGTPVMLAFQHEPENDTNATTDTAASYVRAWRRVVTVFRNQGVSNVSFAWIMMASTFSSSSAANAFYPGDSYIDWVAADGYNWAYNRPGQPWRSFQEIFANFYAWGALHPQPLMIGETGTMDDPNDPTRKAQWFANILPTIQNWPNIKALVYYNAGSTTGNSWRYDNTTTDLTAFQTLAANSYLMP